MPKRYFDEESKVAFYHIIIKVSERTDLNSAYAFDDSQKLYFEKLMHRLEAIYLIDIPAYCIMSTHVHIIVAHQKDLDKELSLKEIAQRFQNYYKLKAAPDARSQKVHKFRKRLNNISELMWDLQRRFTYWYNNQYEVRRTGSLWNPSYKSIALKSGKALADCMKYVELNSVRAKMVQLPDQYRFCSWSHICKNDSWGKYHRGLIKKYLRYFYHELPGDKVFINYAGDLETLCLYVKDNKNIKRIDPYLQAFLLKRCDLWCKLKVIGGEEPLYGTGYGDKRPKTVLFKVE
jgi:putative transposase